MVNFKENIFDKNYLKNYFFFIKYPRKIYQVIKKKKNS